MLVGLVITMPAGFVLSKIIVLLIGIVHVLPTRSVIKILNPIVPSVSVIFMT